MEKCSGVESHLLNVPYVVVFDVGRGNCVSACMRGRKERGLALPLGGASAQAPLQALGRESPVFFVGANKGGLGRGVLIQGGELLRCPFSRAHLGRGFVALLNSLVGSLSCGSRRGVGGRFVFNSYKLWAVVGRDWGCCGGG